jgi:hypothetical protein
MKKKLAMKRVRLKPRMFQCISYVLSSDIKSFHGATWFKKYVKVSGPANTCAVIPANDPSHGKNKEQIGIYMWDYERFADVVDFSLPTYWD